MGVVWSRSGVSAEASVGDSGNSDSDDGFEEHDPRTSGRHDRPVSVRLASVLSFASTPCGTSAAAGGRLAACTAARSWPAGTSSRGSPAAATAGHRQASPLQDARGGDRCLLLGGRAARGADSAKPLPVVAMALRVGDCCFTRVNEAGTSRWVGGLVLDVKTPFCCDFRVSRLGAGYTHPGGRRSADRTWPWRTWLTVAYRPRHGVAGPVRLSARGRAAFSSARISITVEALTRPPL